MRDINGSAPLLPQYFCGVDICFTDFCWAGYYRLIGKPTGSSCLNVLTASLRSKITNTLNKITMIVFFGT